jgi:putative SOS response-associated peptidase YedK
MPAILKTEDRDHWLNGTPDDARAVLAQHDPGPMVAHPVSTRVNTPKNNDATLIEAI